MADNLSVQSIDEDAVRKESGPNTSDAVKLLWSALNEEIAARRRTGRDAKEVDEGKIKFTAPTSAQDDYDDERSTILYFTGSTNFNFTGLRNGVEGRRITLFNLGSASITLKHNASSQTANRLFLSSGADKTLSQGLSIMFGYINAGWRELKWV